MYQLRNSSESPNILTDWGGGSEFSLHKITSQGSPLNTELLSGI